MAAMTMTRTGHIVQVLPGTALCPYQGWHSINALAQDGTLASLFMPNYSYLTYCAEVGKFKIKRIVLQ